MGSRREEEKNEATIRRLLKLPENKRCINCNSMGPQYVCTTFSTFVCTQCSGIHREFSHRIKSVSMAKFTAAEVSALQAGGNERARQSFFRSLDPARVSLPDSGSPEKLRDFIKRVYEKKLYMGDTPPSAQQEEAVAEVRRVEAKPVGRPSDLRSLSFDDHRSSSKGSSFNRRKSDFDRSSMGNRSSPRAAAAAAGSSPQAPTPRPTRHSYDDRDRDRDAHDRMEQQQQSPKMMPDGGGREKRSLSRPFSFRDFDVTPPPAQSITDILGDIPGLRVEVFKHSNGDSPDSSTRSSVDSARKALHSQSFGSVGDDRVSRTTAAAEHQRANSSSLIDIHGETGVFREGVEDPFAEASQVSSATSDSWATFNASPTPPAPPAGYPAPKTETSNQWADFGWGQQPSPTTKSSPDRWSSFGTPSPSKVVPKQEQYNVLPSSGLQSSSSPGQPPRVRRQLPQNFYAPSVEDHLPNLNMHQHQQTQPVFQPPQLDGPLEAYFNAGSPANIQNSQTQLFQAQGQGHGQVQFPGQFQPQGQPQPQPQPQPQLQPLELSHQMPLQSQTPVQRSRNPFDDDFEDDSPASLSSSAATGMNLQFPSMDTLQAALPSSMPVSSGVSALEAAVPPTLPTSGASSDWAGSFTHFNNPTSSSGSFNFSPDQQATTFPMASFLAQPNVPGAYMSPHPFGQEAPFPGNQVHAQNFVRPAGGNPFG